MKNVYLGLALLTLFSCSRNKDKRYFAELLKDVDRLQLKFFNHGDTLSKIIADPQEINIYKELITGKRDPRQKIKCDSTGQILFLQKGDLVLSAWFSSPASGSKYNKPSVAYGIDPDHYSALLNYRSGMDIEDYYYKLRSTAIRVAAEHSSTN